MEEIGRPFQPIKIGMASVETGNDRFSSDIHPSPPIPAFWRLNLTALSQRYNLYFVAIGTIIQVYEPQFPFQKLGDKPKLTIIPQLANPGAPGYIDILHPHIVNNLIIGQLGEEEVLLLSTDSGNVTGYETRAVVNAIRQYATQAPTDLVNQSQADIRPFFSQWVVESAWGLSIHTKGRMIAVSANVSSRYGIEAIRSFEDRASITIFAFALVNDQSDDESMRSTESSSEIADLDKEWEIWDPSLRTSTVTSPPRHKNYKIILAGSDGHPTNIPYVSFFNSMDDPDGAWLLSTDIAENIKLWQIWSGTCVNNWEFKDRGVSGAAWLGIEERGWIAATLDRRAFQPVPDCESFIGRNRAPQHYAFGGKGDSFDITNIVRYHVPSNGHVHPLNDSDSESDLSLDENSIQLDQDLSEFGSIADDAEQGEGMCSYLESGDTLSTNLQMNTETDELYSDSRTSNQMVREDDLSDTLSEEDDDDFEVESDFSEGNLSGGGPRGRHVGILESLTSTSEYQAGHNHPGDSCSCSSSPTSLISPPSEDSEMSSRTFMARSTSADARQQPAVPNAPFIYCSTSHLRFFDNPTASSPHLFCARFLKQAISTAMEDHVIVQMDRLDMMEQIPEIGVLIIASQMGRCAICSLTKRATDGLLGLRVDWILPTQKQERAGIRPHMPLHGIAVSPVHGKRHSRPKGELDGSTGRWTQNRVVSGVTVTFDQTTLDLSGSKQQFSKDSPNPSGSSSKTMATKAYNWSKQKGPDTWTAVDGNKHYKLVMTYADMTVLTYEISRGVEKHDIKTE